MLAPNDIKTVAIVGSGIAGLTAAYLLQQRYQITVFEQNNYVGGHTNTVNVATNSGDYAIDTGFIVFNDQTYPNFIKLLSKLNVAKQKSNMSFSFSSKALQLEYCAETINSLFAQRKNLLRFKFYRLLADVYRFNNAAKKFLRTPHNILLKDFVAQKNYHHWFKQTYLTPMAAAIWSTPPTQVDNIPAQFILQFYQHHGLLNLLKRPQWYVIKGGSQRYVNQLIKPFADRIHVNTPIMRIKRQADGVTLITDNSEQHFDAVVMACHSDQALKLLAKPSAIEEKILSAIPYVTNHVTLHTDHNVLPTQQRAWASWNYQHQDDTKTSLTYYMNKLQSIQAPENFCVSVNQSNINESKILNEFVYAHPTYNQQSVAAKAQHDMINYRNRTFYVGAYWGYGFHEDGVVSSLQALAPLGLSL